MIILEAVYIFIQRKPSNVCCFNGPKSVAEGPSMFKFVLYCEFVRNF